MSIAGPAVGVMWVQSPVDLRIVREANQIINGYTKMFSQGNQSGNLRIVIAFFIAVYRIPFNADNFPDFLLGHPIFKP